MNKWLLFVQIIGRSVTLGLIAGGVLSLIVGILCALMLGIIALGIALLIGIGGGLVMGFLNGLLLAAITCFWFVPLQNEGRYRQVIGFACVLTNIAALAIAQQYAGAIFVGPVAWWGSQYVCDWYQSKNEQAKNEELAA